jgi:hypothetical protein
VQVTEAPEEERQCWLGIASESDDPVAGWVHSCRCRETTKWVNQVSAVQRRVQCSAVQWVQCSEVFAPGVHPSLGRREAEEEQHSRRGVPVGAAQCSAVVCSAVQCSSVQCCVVQYSGVQCSAVQRSARRAALTT